MSWLSEQIGSGSENTATGQDPRTYTPGYWTYIRENKPAFYDTLKEYDPVFINEQKARETAAQSSATAQQLARAQNVAPTSTVVPDDQLRADALNNLSTAFGGDPNSLVSSSLDDAPITSYFNTQRGKANDYIGNLLKRGVVSQTGSNAGFAALSQQDPKVRTRLNDIGNVLLEQERGKVRGIYGEGANAAGQLTAGQNFDPSSYLSRAQQDVGGFQARLPDALAAQAGSDLFDTSGLSASSGAASGSQNLDYDPYAIPGGKLDTNPASTNAPVTKRRSTAVF